MTNTANTNTLHYDGRGAWADGGAGAQTFTTWDLGADYPTLFRSVMRVSQRYSPRGRPTLEVRGFQLKLLDPSFCLVARPGFNRALLWAEACQIVAGWYDDELFDAVTTPATAARLTSFGAYGPRTTDQMQEVLDELRQDPDSRRAVVYLGRPDDLAQVRALTDFDREVPPCTQTWQFLVRDGRLEMHVTMRSWDLVWGLGYDVPNAAVMQMFVAGCLGLRLGPLLFTAASAHIYERHWDLVPVSRPGRALENPYTPATDDQWQAHRRRARQALVGWTLPQVTIPGWEPAMAAWREAAARRRGG